MINVPVAIASSLGTLGTGWLAEKIGPRSPTAIAWLPAAGMTLAVPFYVLAFTTHNLMLCLAGLLVGGGVKYGYLAAQYTIGQGVVSAQTRALSTAILMFVINLVGYGFGPLFIGWLSDVLFAAQVSALDAPGLTRSLCEGPARKALSATLEAACAVAHPQSLQCSLLITAGLYAVGGGLFLLTCRWLKDDMVAK
jgi:MFS family permease